MSYRKSFFVKITRLPIIIFIIILTFAGCKKEKAGSVTLWTTVVGFNNVPTKDILVGVFDISLINQSVQKNHALFTTKFQHAFNTRYEVTFSDLLPGNYFVAIEQNVNFSQRRAFQIKNGDEIEIELK
ncbi:MAG: hypothetical protein JJU02_15405 [Cryomorphaceae bacterium]|nr:hypothetical protein [Cryomorphaceae bacterium]